MCEIGLAQSLSCYVRPKYSFVGHGVMFYSEEMICCSLQTFFAVADDFTLLGDYINFATALMLIALSTFFGMIALKLNGSVNIFAFSFPSKMSLNCL